jgi:hypothetical protein
LLFASLQHETRPLISASFQISKDPSEQMTGAGDVLVFNDTMRITTRSLMTESPESLESQRQGEAPATFYNGLPEARRTSRVFGSAVPDVIARLDDCNNINRGLKVPCHPVSFTSRQGSCGSASRCRFKQPERCVVPSKLDC